MAVIRVNADREVTPLVEHASMRRSFRQGPNRAIRTGGGWRSAVLPVTGRSEREVAQRVARLVEGQQSILDAARQRMRAERD